MGGDRPFTANAREPLTTGGTWEPLWLMEGPDLTCPYMEAQRPFKDTSYPADL